MESWFSRALVKWYQINKRDLPWRHHRDAYKIWLSEIILQQTQVAQGLAYYNAFTSRYPGVTQLAQASEDEVLKLWQGLGYYSRARNLHAAAKIIDEQHGGIFPATYDEIKALKGVGDYTAAAIASFAYNLPHAVVDGNVYRVLSRIFGIETPIDTTPAKKEFQLLANSLLDHKNPALHNQAIMEFGSQYCRPVSPNCPDCIFNSRCLAYKTGRVAELPVKAKKIKTRNRFFNYIVLLDQHNSIRIHRRTEGDIWQGLYEFCLLETDAETTAEQLFALPAFKALCGSGFSLLYTSKTYRHVLTHQHLYARFYVIKARFAFKDGEPASSAETLNSFAFSRLTEKFMDDCSLKELF